MAGWPTRLNDKDIGSWLTAGSKQRWSLPTSSELAPILRLKRLAPFFHFFPAKPNLGLSLPLRREAKSQLLQLFRQWDTLPAPTAKLVILVKKLVVLAYHLTLSGRSPCLQGLGAQPFGMKSSLRPFPSRKLNARSRLMMRSPTSSR